MISTPPTEEYESGIWDPDAIKKASERPFRILCVEDNDGDFLLLRQHVGEADFKFPPSLERAATLETAIDSLKAGRNGSEPFDIILLDLSLPDSQGPRTFSEVVKSAEGTPITILSGNDDRDLAVEMVKQGAQDYLQKDLLNGDVLSRSILYAVERERAFSELARMNAKLRKKSRDLKTAQMQLIQAEKLDSLGRIAAGVAHEVKNPLATLQMGVDFFKRRGEGVDESTGIMVEQMQEAIGRAETIIRGMVDYSRDETLTLELRNINVIVRRALRMIDHEAVNAKVVIDRDLSTFIPAIRCDQGKIEQVLINLCANAIHAMAGMEGSDKWLRVRTFWDQIQEIERDEGLRDFDRLRARDHVVVVEIRDEGNGIPEDKLSRIFEPFYTTKPTGQGTGLGLSVTKNIIDLHRGHIQIKNVTNPRGARVRIFFKAHEVPKGKLPPDESLTRPIKPPTINES